MRVALLNAPWYDPRRPELWGVRAGSRWPHFQRRSAPGKLPRYLPFPFFLAIAARAIREAGHDVLLLDAVAENLTLEPALEKIRAFGPALLFAETSTPSLAWDLSALRQLKTLLPGLTLAAGGTHAPSLAQALLREEGLPDFWLAGEFDASLPLLVQALAAGADPAAVPGLVTARLPFRGLARVERVDDLPPPLYEQLPMGSYSDPVCGLPSPSAQSWLSRGCPFGCTFCVWPQLVYGERRYRPRQLTAALAEVERLVADFGCESFYFDDDTANLGDGRMLELARLLRERGLDKTPWAMMARADCMGPRAIEALAGAGLYSIKYGVESCSPKLLNACEKGTDPAKLRAAIDRTRSAGVKLHLTFTFGLPGETPETLRETLAYALEAAPETAQFSLCTPFPGTRFYDECKASGWLVTEDWSRFLGSDEAVVSTPWLSAGALHALHAEACAAWANFTASRLERRRAALLQRVREAIGRGERWTLLGEREAAAFLFEAGVDVREACVAEEAPGAVSVIVSRHDEEKLYRRLKRRSPDRARRALKLYG